jgi:hypothetical protein
MLALCLTLALGAADGQRLALVVGNNTYADDDWTALRFAEKDARDMAAALRESFDEVIELSAGPVTRHGLLEAMAKLAVKSTSADDTVLIYLSMHGTLTRNARGELVRVLVTHDTSGEKPLNTGVLYDDLLSHLDRMRSRHKVLILAACHAGAGKSVLTASLAHELSGLKGAFFSEPPAPRSEGRIVLAASAWGEAAREDDKLENDIYTHFFLQALGGFDRNKDGATTVLEAHDYARSRTLDYTRGAQRPTLTAEIVGEDSIILRGTLARRGDPLIAAYGAGFVGARLFVNGREKGTFPGGFLLDESGEARIEVLRPDADEPMFADTLEVGSGAAVVLDDIVASSGGHFWVGGVAAWQGISGDVGRSYIGSMPLVGPLVEWQSPDMSLQLSGGLLATRVSQSVTVPSGLDSLDVRQDLQLVQARLQGGWVVWQGRVVQLAPMAHVAWNVGQRTLPLDSLHDAAQVVSFGQVGAGIGVAFPLMPDLAVKLSSSVVWLFVRTEGTTVAALSQQHGLSVVYQL